MCELFAAIACLPPALSGFNSRYYRIRGPPPRCPDPCGRGTSLSPQRKLTNQKLASFLNIAGFSVLTPRTKAGLIDHAACTASILCLQLQGLTASDANHRAHAKELVVCLGVPFFFSLSKDGARERKQTGLASC